MSAGRSLRRGGAHTRLVEPSWRDPLDTSHSRRTGGRWNASGAFGVLYLNGSLALARLQVAHTLVGQPYAIEDLDPREQHDLVEVEVAGAQFLDCVSDDGLAAMGLPATYPRDVPHATCQPIGADAHATDLAGVACRSAAAGATREDEELAVFDRVVGTIVTQGSRRPFGEWYLAA